MAAGSNKALPNFTPSLRNPEVAFADAAVQLQNLAEYVPENQSSGGNDR
jgi:hypothetical protein